MNSRIFSQLLHSQGIKELRVFQQLHKLRLPNFVDVIDHCQLRHPLALFSSADAPEQGAPDGQYLYCLLEYGGKHTMHQRQSLPVEEVRGSYCKLQLFVILYRSWSLLLDESI